jgi:hypothetical protein
MQKRASLISWRTTASRVNEAVLKARLRIAGPETGAGEMSERGSGRVERRLNGFRGAAGRVGDHADQGLGEQQ